MKAPCKIFRCWIPQIGEQRRKATEVRFDTPYNAAIKYGEMVYRANRGGQWAPGMARVVHVLDVDLGVTHKLPVILKGPAFGIEKKPVAA